MERLVAVCPHLDEGESTVAWAMRDEPAGLNDSGWRLVCSAGEAGEISVNLRWTIAHLLRKEPGLAPYIDSIAGTTIQKVPGTPGSWQRWR
jgi:hypothetical protein